MDERCGKQEENLTTAQQYERKKNNIFLWGCQ
jgi:hypothetical protein